MAHVEPVGGKAIRLNMNASGYAPSISGTAALASAAVPQPAPLFSLAPV